ncbi:MAG TPA: HAMP domain-containing histidine kinase [Candidatus Melainabacteria bacterium]|nr:HAMP domain-containing histidine kinase [Candidatus Melainabacteria bacterium]HIN66352.1 HAMP domain-containing histidine kinase [Candidatus Obscuribacterales bacterium]
MRFPLATKGLVLVALPIAMELLCLSWLWHVVMDANAEARKQANARDIAAETGHILLLFFQLGSQVLIYRAEGSAGELKVYNRLKETMKQSTTKLTALSADLSSEEKTRVNQIEERMDRSVALVGSYIKEMTSPSHHPGSFNVAAFRKQLMDQVLPLADDAKYFNDVGKANDLYGQWTKRASNQRHLLLIVSLVLPNILMAIVLATFYTKSVRNRIRRIDSNVNRFLDGRMLDRSMPAEDEISELDEAFHRMTEKLIAADLEMRDYYESMQKNLAEPLRALREVLFASSQTASPLTESGRAKVLKSVGTTDRLISLIEELGKIDAIAGGGVHGATAMKVELSGCQLEEIVSSAIASVAEFAAKKDISVAANVSDTTSLQADSHRLIQVLVNLLSNAIKFSPSGSAIEVTTMTSNKFVEVHVKDQGPGIPVAEQDRLFRRFEQIESITSRDIKGSGLGLSICRDIVVAHGGEIGVRSEPGKGSVFWFRIPKM